VDGERAARPPRAMAVAALLVAGCVIPAPLNSQDPALTRPLILSGVPAFTAGRYYPLRSGDLDGGLLSAETQIPFSVTVFYPDSTVPQLYPAFYRQKLDGTFVALSTERVLVQQPGNPHLYAPAPSISFPMCSTTEVSGTDIDWLVFVYVADGGPWPANLEGRGPGDVARGNYDYKYWVVNCQ
jgi:hypothetical protein